MLTNSQKCEDVKTIALKKAKWGADAKVIDIRRKDHESNDVVVVVSLGSEVKEIVVNKRMLSAHESARSKAKEAQALSASAVVA